MWNWNWKHFLEIMSSGMPAVCYFQLGRTRNILTINFIKEKSHVSIPRFFERFVGLFCLGPVPTLPLPKIMNFRVHYGMVLSASVISSTSDFLSQKPWRSSEKWVSWRTCNIFVLPARQVASILTFTAPVTDMQ